MRRSQAPSQIGLNKENGISNENNRLYKKNVEAMRSQEDMVITRMPLLDCLRCKSESPALRGNFKCPFNTLTDEALALRQIKTLGARRKSGGNFTSFKPHSFDVLHDGAEGVAIKDLNAEEMADKERVQLILWQAKTPDEEGKYHQIEVDYILAKFLRQHQREGVQFVFDCLCGKADFEGQGCILADDMGLGKTLQSITILYTMLKQGFDDPKTVPIVPLVKKAIIVCPTVLVKNWANEIDKWLKGAGGINKIALSEGSRDLAIAGINEWLRPRSAPILIISYETFRMHQLRFKNATCDLMICDEAHRLKNSSTQTNQSLSTLNCKRRLLLSGTPMQNDLEEFFAMINFANPDLLGDARTFSKRFMKPILAGREPDATDNQMKIAEERSEELSNIVNKFVLRRTNALLVAHLPPKVTQIVVCSMTDMQKSLYNHFLNSKAAAKLLKESSTSVGGGGNVLASITLLKKLCNHPKLIMDSLSQNKDKKKPVLTGFEGCEHLFPAEFRKSKAVMAAYSGKMEVLATLLGTLRFTTKDRIVLVSNYTQTLDMFEQLCKEKRYPCIRLDGSTTASKRQPLVDNFNDFKQDQFVFLLSSKAGGCGINLIGGNRLVLFDPDWNPANDKQAAARIWRDGQKKKVYIYRFLAQGTIEEKIYQRQISKEGLQTIVVDSKSENNSFSSTELRELFTLDEKSVSNTHEMIDCDRCDRHNENEGFSTQIGKPPEDNLLHWAHHFGVSNLHHDLQLKQSGMNHVKFVFALESDHVPVPGEEFMAEDEEEEDKEKKKKFRKRRRKKDKEEGVEEKKEGEGEEDDEVEMLNHDDDKKKKMKEGKEEKKKKKKTKDNAKRDNFYVEEEENDDDRAFIVDDEEEENDDDEEEEASDNHNNKDDSKAEEDDDDEVEGEKKEEEKEVKMEKEEEDNNIDDDIIKEEDKEKKKIEVTKKKEVDSVVDDDDNFVAMDKSKKKKNEKAKSVEVIDLLHDDDDNDEEMNDSSSKKRKKKKNKDNNNNLVSPVDDSGRRRVRGRKECAHCEGVTTTLWRTIAEVEGLFYCDRCYEQFQKNNNKNNDNYNNTSNNSINNMNTNTSKNNNSSNADDDDPDLRPVKKKKKKNKSFIDDEDDDFV